MSGAFGTSSCKRPKRLPSIAGSRGATPVALPPGLFRLATSPSCTGSAPLIKTIGIVAVAAFAASPELGPPTAAMTVTWRLTSSAASAGSRSYRPSATDIR